MAYAVRVLSAIGLDLGEFRVSRIRLPKKALYLFGASALFALLVCAYIGNAGRRFYAHQSDLTTPNPPSYSYPYSLHRPPIPASSFLRPTATTIFLDARD